MTQVFLAYKRGDDDAKAKAVREKLEALGVPLFIDLMTGKVDGGDNYITTINKQLAGAAAVLVLWTESSIKSEFVISEAEKGFNRKVLVSAMFGKIVQDLPVPFNKFNVANLTDWIENGASHKHPEWQTLLQMLGHKLNRPALAPLAEAIEDGTEQAKRAFLRAYPGDPSAIILSSEVVAAERKAFDQRMREAQARLNRRRQEADKKLRACQHEFEEQLLELRAGRDYMPPDPVGVLNDNVKALEDQIEVYKTATDEYRMRAEEAEARAARTADNVGVLRQEIAQLMSVESALDPSTEKFAIELDRLRSDLSDSEALVSAKTEEIQGLNRTLTEARHDVETRDKELEALRTQTPQPAPGAGRRSPWLPLASAAIPLALALGVFGGLMLGNGSIGGGAGGAPEELARRQKAIEEAEHQLSIRTSEVTKKEKLADDKLAKTAQREQAVTQAEGDITARTAELTKKEQDADQRLKAVAAREQAVRAAPDAVSARAAELTKKEQEADAKLASITQREQNAGQKEIRLSAKEAELNQRDKDLGARLTEILARAPATPSARPSEQQGEPAVSLAVPLGGSFKDHVNQDMDKGDLQTLKDVDQQACVAACGGNMKCKAYSFDRWNRFCFLKSEIGALRLDPRSVTGIRSNLAAPPAATSEIEFEPHHRKEFPGAAYKTLRNTPLVACEASCRKEQSCMAYTFKRTDQACKLFDAPVAYVSDESSDSGLKFQRP